MKKNTIFNITIVLLVLVFIGMVSLDAMAREVTTNIRSWLEEKEFALDSSLHATLDQVIIFDLEPADAHDRHTKRHIKYHDKFQNHYEEDHGNGQKYRKYKEKKGKYYAKYEKNKDKYRKNHKKNKDKHKKQKLYLGDHELKWNSVRFLIPEATEVSFCLPEEEPYIAALELETADGERVLWSRPGDDCRVLELEADRYRLHVLHDGTELSTSGAKAFLHRPTTAFLLGSSNNPDMVPDFIALRGPDGQFVSSDTSPPLITLQTAATAVGPQEVWYVAFAANAQGVGTKFRLHDGNNNAVKVQVDFFGDPPGGINAGNKLFIGTDDPNNVGCCDDAVTTFRFHDLGNGIINLDMAYRAPQTLLEGPVGLNPDNELHYSQVNTDFTWDYKGFDCGSACDSSNLPLQEGEVALFAGCNYTGPAIVFRDDVPRFSIYNGAAGKGLAMGNDMAASVRVGPNTLAFLYADGQFGGSFTGVGADVPCLDETNLGSSTASSLQIETLSQYILSTNTCENCILTGIDLSNYDLSDGIYSGSTFSGANLTDTNFQGATLTSANFFGATTALTQTDFTNALMQCTDLSRTDLSDSIFGAGPVLTTDFSCRLDLSLAKLNIDTLPFADWRYLNMNDATIFNGAGTTISTLADPVDFSGALLSGVTGLSGAILDGADLGCATPASENENCTQLIDTDLSKVSLIQANLTDAAMNGANLNQANLEKSNLSGVQLSKSPNTSISAKLDGTYLKNANLAQADLSGVTLKNANWYSSSEGVCPGSTWTGTCASGEGATLSNADLEGAYLNGLDLSGATLQGANLSGAMLVGANFTRANLSVDPNTGSATTFSGAFLQGAVFTDPTSTTGADFLNSYVDLTNANGGDIVFQLPVDNLEFTGYGKDPDNPECVYFGYSQITMVPDTDSGNTCPDGSNGACTDTQWQSPITPIDQAQPPSSRSLSPAGNCTEIDFNW